MHWDCPLARVAYGINKASSATSSVLAPNSATLGWEMAETTYMYFLLLGIWGIPRFATDMLQNFSYNAYCFLNLSATLYYVNPYVVVHLSFGPKSISNPFSLLPHWVTLLSLKMSIGVVSYPSFIRRQW